MSTLIKLFASDLDGTLYNGLHQTDGGIVRRLRRVVGAGRHVALATGRWSSTGAELGFGDLPLEVVCGNGAFVYGASGELLRSVEIDPATVEGLLRAFPTCCLVCVSADGTFVRGSRADQLAGYLPPHGLLGRFVAWQARRRGPGADMVFDQTEADVLAHPICKVNCRVADSARGEELKAFLAERPELVVNAPFSPVMFEMTDPAVNKGAAIAWLARYYGYTEDEVAVYGDGGNDIAMLERFKHAYATSNGSDDAKRAAGNVIGSCRFHAVPRHMMAKVRRQGRVASYIRIE